MPRYDSNTVAAIHEALDDEYKARATYAAVIERFGAVRPFANIIASEDRHARALERLLAKDGLPIPADRWAGRVTAPDSLQQAYALGVRAEIDNRAMYDRLQRMTAEPDVLRVFANLRAASQDNHLPAFQRHLDRDGGAGAASAGIGGERGGGGKRRGMRPENGTTPMSPRPAAGGAGGTGRGNGGGIGQRHGHGHGHGGRGHHGLDR